MASWLSGTASVTHKTPMPAGISRQAAVEYLQEHEHFLRRSPNMLSFEPKTPDVPPTLPDDVEGLGPTACFDVTDQMAAMPAGLSGVLGSKLHSVYEFTDVADGVFLRILAPLGVVLDTVWHIAGDESTGLEIVEDLTVKCSRLMVSMVRKECEANWEEMHGKIVTALTTEAPAA